VIEETRLSYKVYMKLTIRNFSRKDIGIYNCLATNSIGRAEESIRVHGKEAPSPDEFLSKKNCFWRENIKSALALG